MRPGISLVVINLISMSLLSGIHHIAVICSDYERSKAFYTQVLGMQVVREVYREERRSWKLDLALGTQYVIELFSFPAPPPRPSRPEAQGLRHLAFTVADVEEAVRQLQAAGVSTEPIRTDPYTGKRFTFFTDPDGLPLELYEI
jgi:glyoxylase I family protein